MTAVRAILGFAIATVLSGVPSSAFAAGNELSAADASPRSGTTLTLFTLSVEYHGGFPALTVTAEAGGRALPMLPALGTTPLDGRWSVTALLPAGTWTVRFVATASQGNDPRLDGPSVTVLNVESPTPVPSFGGDTRPGSPPTFSDPVGGGGGAAPAPTNAPAAPADTLAPGASAPMLPAGTTMPAPAESAPGDVPSGNTGRALQPAGGAGVTGASATTMPASAMASSAPGMASSAPDAVRHGTATDTADPSAAPALIDDSPSAALPTTAALATLAILGSVLVLARRRRRSAAETAPAGAAPSVDDEVTAALRRRTLRRSRRRLDEDDPIVASLGVTGKGTTPPAPPTGGRGRRVPPA